MKYKMLIFDLDGTILDTTEDLCAACNYALSYYNLPIISVQRLKQLVGHGIKNLVYEASNHSDITDDILKQFKNYYKENFNVFTRAYKDIEKVFTYCHQQQIVIGVYTNKVEFIAKPLVEEHFPKTMQFIYGDYQDRPRKPDPTFLLEILKEYNISKNEVLYIGDSEVDINLCRNAQIPGLFVSYGYRTKEELLKYTTNVIDSSKEILEYLKN